MQISALRETARSELTSFAWDQWAQLGVFAPTERRDHWAADPEALLLFTLEIGRNDPRLLDEALDWLLTNERLISVQRLRNLAIDDDDRDLADAAVAWVARWQPSNRFAPRKHNRPDREPRPLFRTVAQQVVDPDPAFLSVGFLKPNTEPSRKSRQPDPTLPISFAFRTRLLFGVGSRAEVVRYLLTGPAPDVSAQMVADAAGYAKRNISDTLAALAGSRLVTSYERGNENRYYINRAAWGQLFEFRPDTWPTYRDWPRLLRVLRLLARWLEQPGLDDLTPYMRASEARTLMAELEPELAIAGIAIPSSVTLEGEQFWNSFAETIQATLASLNTWWG
jgi:hypothetical protein